MAVYC